MAKLVVLLVLLLVKARATKLQKHFLSGKSCDRQAVAQDCGRGIWGIAMVQIQRGPPAAGGGAPPAGDGPGGEAPPAGDGPGGEAPPAGDGPGGEAPPAGDGSGEAPPAGDGSGEAPPAGDGSGEDLTIAEAAVAKACSIQFPRIEGESYIGIVGPCGGHTGDYHFHRGFGCLYEESGGHSSKVGVVAAYNLYGKWEDYANNLLPLLDACGAHFGPTPDSSGNVYHYHVQDKAPFTVGCYGPSASNQLVTVAECRALYPKCDNDGGAGTAIQTNEGTVTYDKFCPCWDAAGSNMGINLVELPALSTSDISYPAGSGGSGINSAVATDTATTTQGSGGSNSAATTTAAATGTTGSTGATTTGAGEAGESTTTSTATTASTSATLPCINCRGATTTPLTTVSSASAARMSALLGLAAFWALLR
ncbi:unnamed protein product [Effrenium voratum]|nr:unnamed protein product [Effrenium voratum]